MIPVTHNLSLADDELVFRAVLASGPGGQAVNKTSTAVELRFDARGSPSLPGEVKARLERLAGSRLTKDGVIVILAQVHRSQELNRRDAQARLVALIRRAALRPKVRRPTRPTLASKVRRVEGKVRRGVVKGLRGRPVED